MKRAPRKTRKAAGLPPKKQVTVIRCGGDLFTAKQVRVLIDAINRETASGLRPL